MVSSLTPVSRFLVAEEDIKPGELVANETSYTAVLGMECGHIRKSEKKL